MTPLTVPPVSSSARAPGLQYRKPLPDGATGDLPPEAVEFVAVAHRNTRRLTALINDVLDLAKIDADLARIGCATRESVRTDR